MAARMLQEVARDFFEAILLNSVIAAITVYACTYNGRTKPNAQDLPILAYTFLLVAAAIGLVSPYNYPIRVRHTAAVIILIASTSLAVLVGLVVGFLIGAVPWYEIGFFIPPFWLATVILRVGCRELSYRADELTGKYYCLDEARLAYPVCGTRDRPKDRCELWGPRYHARCGVWVPGMLWQGSTGKYVCLLAGSGCEDGPFEHSRDLAEHLLNVHWDDGFHCPGCWGSLRRVQRYGGWVL